MRPTEALLLPFLCALFWGANSKTAGRISCGTAAGHMRDGCVGHRSYLPFQFRGCECDPECAEYGDCCVGAPNKSSAPPRDDVECLQYGYDRHAGVYVVSKCDERWNGSTEVKQKCEGPTHFSDPASVVPVTDLRITYKNVHCAECHHAGKESLKSFGYEYACGQSGSSQEEESNDRPTYNPEKNKWGVYVSGEDDGEPTFSECEVIFHLDPRGRYRHCRANVVSECPDDWTDDEVRRQCHGYNSVVYDALRGYRNPHCALCRGATFPLSCSSNRVDTRRKRTPSPKKPFSFSALTIIFDPSFMNVSCPDDHLFDPLNKKCRKLSCALPGYVVRDGRCVRGDQKTVRLDEPSKAEP